MKSRRPVRFVSGGRQFYPKPFRESVGIRTTSQPAGYDQL